MSSSTQSRTPEEPAPADAETATAEQGKQVPPADQKPRTVSEQLRQKLRELFSDDTNVYPLY